MKAARGPVNVHPKEELGLAEVFDIKLLLNFSIENCRIGADDYQIVHMAVNPCGVGTGAMEDAGV